MNKAVLIGRLTTDPEMRTTQSGISVTSFTLAVDRRFKNAQGEREADFIRCTAWRQTAEFICKYFGKGAKLGAVGTIQTGSYEKDGVRHYTTEVVIEEAYFVESKRSYEDEERAAIQNEPPADPGARNYQQEYKPRPSDDTALPFDL